MLAHIASPFAGVYLWHNWRANVPDRVDATTRANTPNA